MELRINQLNMDIRETEELIKEVKEGKTKLTPKQLADVKNDLKDLKALKSTLVYSS